MQEWSVFVSLLFAHALVASIILLREEIYKVDEPCSKKCVLLSLYCFIMPGIILWVQCNMIHHLVGSTQYDSWHAVSRPRPNLWHDYLNKTLLLMNMALLSHSGNRHDSVKNWHKKDGKEMGVPLDQWIHLKWYDTKRGTLHVVW